jgi:hypothetical protein
MRQLTITALALTAACAGGHDRINDTALASVPAAEPPASAPPPSAAPVGPPVAVPPPRTAREDSIIAHARVVLAAANPEFREWPAAAYAPVQSDSATASARVGPLVGDLDGDGEPDVAFDGYRSSGGGLILAVLSNGGQAKVLTVTGEEIPIPPSRRWMRWMLAPYELRGKRGVGIAVVDYNDGGWPVLPASLYALVNGHFTQIIDGE